MEKTVSHPICIFILDHYSLVSSGLRLILESDPELTVIGDAAVSTVAREKVACQNPDIILLKLNPQGDPDLEIIPRLLEISNQTRIILLISTEDFSVCSQAIELGVVGIVSETQSPQTLIKAIKKVHEGEIWVEGSMMAHFVNSISYAHRNKQKDPDAELISHLTNRERQVIQYIGMGLKNKQIANQLCISEVTVRHHLTSVYNKLGVADRLELLVFAHRSSLI